MHTPERLVARVRAEYREMPGLSLTTEQASRLLGVQPAICRTVLQTLVTEGILYNPRGVYIAAPSIRDRGKAPQSQ
jgi:hypothetical protein